MGRTHWLIEETSFSNDCDAPQRMTYILREMGNPVTNFKYGGLDTVDVSTFPTTSESPVVFLGTLGGLREVKRKMIAPPAPFSWYDLELFKCAYYYHNLRDFVIPKSIRLCRLRDLPELIPGSEALFIRPDENEKAFTGTVVHRDRFDAWYKMIVDYWSVDEDTIVVTSPPVKMIAEWRFIIVSGVVVTGSQYSTNTCVDISPDYPEEAKAFALKVIQTWVPHSVCVVDVGLVENQGYRVVEIGPFNYAGLYMCDLRKVAVAINSFCEDVHGY